MTRLRAELQSARAHGERGHGVAGDVHGALDALFVSDVRAGPMPDDLFSTVPVWKTLSP